MIGLPCVVFGAYVTDVSFSQRPLISRRDLMTISTRKTAGDLGYRNVSKGLHACQREL